MFILYYITLYYNPHKSLWSHDYAKYVFIMSFKRKKQHNGLLCFEMVLSKHNDSVAVFICMWTFCIVEKID